ncbi:MAG: VacJ family lipoprotein [Parvibaculum sp.]
MKSLGIAELKRASMSVCASVAVLLLAGLTVPVAMAAETAPTTAPASTTTQGTDENDPLEPMNRYFFEVNRFLDTIALKPVATWYDGVLPGFAKDGVRNFLDNLRSPVILANDLLQGEWDRAGTTASRFAVNTTVGVAGLMDPASKWGMAQHGEDFGQTLAVYGTGEGPYLYLPVLGPAPIRDLSGFVVDQFFDPLTYVYWDGPNTVPVARFVLNGVDLRARNLGTLDQIERTSVDYYATIRNLYRQSRVNEINNGQTNVDTLPDIDNLNFDTNEPQSVEPTK